MERDWGGGGGSRGSGIVCVWGGGGYMCAHVWIQGRRRDRVRHVVHY